MKKKLKKLAKKVKPFLASAKDHKLALLNLVILIVILARQEVVIKELEELHGIVVIVALRLSFILQDAQDQFAAAINSILSLFNGKPL